MSLDSLAQIIVDRQLLPTRQTEQWLRQAADEDCYLEQILIRENVFSRAQLLELLENHFFCPSLALENVAFSAGNLSLVPQQVAKRHLVFPIESDATSLKVVLPNPDDQKACEAVQGAARTPSASRFATRTEAGHRCALRTLPARAGAGFSHIQTDV
jgi:type IV pilus assembly protein PilB